MFPIRDRRGRTVGFGGRVLDDSTPKYLNSPETPVFRKHREVYGLFEALEVERSPRQIIVVEGYLDVITLGQSGLTSTVATLGTATSEDHIALLFRFTDEIVFCFDGDAAGIKGAWKAVLATLRVLPDGKTARFLRLPDGQDPDSLVRAEGPEPFRRRVAAAPLLSEYFFTQLAHNIDLATIEGRARVLKLASPLLQAMQPGAFRDMMLVKLRELTARQPGPPPARHAVRRPRAAMSTRPSALVRLLSLLIANPHLALELDHETRTSATRDPMLGRFLEAIISFVGTRPEASAAELRAHLQTLPRSAQLDELLQIDTLVPEGGLQAEFEGTLRLILQQTRERRLDELIGKSRGQELSASEREELRRLIAKPLQGV